MLANGLAEGLVKVDDFMLVQHELAWQTNLHKVFTLPRPNGGTTCKKGSSLAKQTKP